MSTPQSACEQLAQSRERLRLALRQVTSPSNTSPDLHSGSSNTDWLSSLNALPGTKVLLEALHSWWDRQPMQVALKLASDAALVVLQPMAHRHPYRLVIISAAVGAAVALIRPWRWLSATALLAGFIPKLLSESLKHIPAPQAARGTAPSNKP